MMFLISVITPLPGILTYKWLSYGENGRSYIDFDSSSLAAAIYSPDSSRLSPTAGGRGLDANYVTVRLLDVAGCSWPNVNHWDRI